ncbi:unnamed protein product [Sphagnum jensenii]|uniref:Uncharacterized protein n=1 Tax=Sphagnum jensenii TaxID=128206 RepID=A0ABP0WPS8_9BRYO
MKGASERERANGRKTTNTTTDDDALDAAGAAARDGALKPSASIKGHKKPLSYRRAKEEEALFVAFYLTWSPFRYAPGACELLDCG